MFPPLWFGFILLTSSRELCLCFLHQQPMMYPMDRNVSTRCTRQKKPSQEENKSNHFGSSTNDKNSKGNVRSNSSALVKSEAMPRHKIAPLSGKPFFTIIMSKSQVQGPYQLTIPTSFCYHLPCACVPVVLTYGSKEWEMRYHGDRPFKRLDGGWKQFVVDNRLRIGDGCVFELMDDKNVRFELRILSGEVPEMFAGCGRYSEIPITIE